MLRQTNVHGQDQTTKQLEYANAIVARRSRGDRSLFTAQTRLLFAMADGKVTTARPSSRVASNELHSGKGDVDGGSTLRSEMPAGRADKGGEQRGCGAGGNDDQRASFSLPLDGGRGGQRWRGRVPCLAI